ncbi:MAG TPA: phage holin family protein [Stellaceae bacterium]|nr:phage holin family protein [Stellaceae bacterium]
MSEDAAANDRTAGGPGERAAGTERSFTALLADLATEAGLLLRQEIALFKAELAEKRGLFGRGAVLLAGGACIAFGGFLALLAAAAAGLALVMPVWEAALIVGVAALVLGGALACLGRRRLAARELVPRRTLASLREDEAWLREQFR